jgi:hypothetical protein
VTIELRDPRDSFVLECLGWDSGGDLLVHVVAQTRWFRVDFHEYFVEGELEEWEAGIRRLHRDMAGSYTFRAMHNWLQVTYAMGKKGELHISILLQNAPDYLNEVRLFLNLDQSYLPEMANRIAEFGKAG